MTTLKEATQPRDTSNMTLVTGVRSTSAPAIRFPSAPTSADPEFGPLALAPIPPVLGTDTDQARQFYRIGVSQLRMPPLPAAASPAAGAAAASQAIQVQASANLAGALDMPLIFAVSGDRPITSGGNAIDVTLVNQLAGTVFAGPISPSTSTPQLDQETASTGSGTTSLSVGPLSPNSAYNEWAIMVVSGVTPTASDPVFTPSAGWTALQPISGASGQGASWFQNVTAPITGTATLGTSGQYAACLALFYAPEGSPTVVQSKYGAVLGTGGYSVAFTNNLTVGNSILVLIESVNTTGQPSFTGFTDTQGNVYSHIGSQGIVTGGNSSSVDIYFAENVSSGADTISFTTIGGQAGQGIVWIAEINGLGLLTGIPNFRRLVTSDLPTSGTWPFSGTVSGNITFSGNVKFTGEILDSTSSAGTNGQVLTSTGSAVIWAAPTGNGGATVKNGNYLATGADSGTLLSFNTNTGAGWSLIQTATGGGTTATFGAPATAGNLIIVTTSSLTGTNPTLSGGPCSSYTQLGTTQNRGDGYYIAMFWGVANSAGTTVTASGLSSFPSVGMREFFGNAASPFDVTNGVGSQSSTTVGTGVTTTTDGDLIVEFAFDDAGPGSFTPSPSFTTIPSSGSSNNWYLYGPVGAAGTYTPTVTFPGATGWAAITAAFKPAAGQNLTLTLPASPPSTKWNIHVGVWGVGTLTISPNGLLIDGSPGSLIGLVANQGLYITTDGTNYYTNRGM